MNCPVGTQVRRYLKNVKNLKEVNKGSMYYYFDPRAVVSPDSEDLNAAYELRCFREAEYAINMTPNRIEVLKNRNDDVRLNVVAEALAFV